VAASSPDFASFSGYMAMALVFSYRLARRRAQRTYAGITIKR
jgi:hypothetical protein